MIFAKKESWKRAAVFIFNTTVATYSFKGDEGVQYDIAVWAILLQDLLQEIQSTPLSSLYQMNWNALMIIPSRQNQI